MTDSDFLEQVKNDPEFMKAIKTLYSLPDDRREFLYGAIALANSFVEEERRALFKRVK